MRRLVKASGVAVAALLLVVTVPVGMASADQCKDSPILCGVESDSDKYSGVLVFPGWVSGDGASGTGGTSTCGDCEWTYVPACHVNTPDNGADALCGAAVNSCPSRGQEGILMWVYLRRPGEPWRQVGVACIGGTNDVVTLADLTVDAQRAYRDQLKPPAATVVQHPADRAVVGFATYFSANGAAPLSGTFGTVAARMTITATPTYVWDWGDGSEPYETTDPGGPYPDGTTHHTYRRAATTTVSLTTRWSATFVVDTAAGRFGPFPVTGPAIAPTTTQQVTVREARAELIGG
jgi:hypothetical protein